jgi:predicted NUDIX family phosphoesterase
METDPSFKQLIPYMIFRHIAADGTPSIFQYTRGSGQGEQRLHAKVSVGVGGHISSIDERNDGAHTYAEGMSRELHEEIILDTPYTEKVVGLINDDETEVGKVHLGVVHLFDVEQPNIRPHEDEIIEAGFRPLEETMQRLDAMETWSSICMKSLFGE